MDSSNLSSTSQSNDGTPMWGMMSSEDEEALKDKFQAESEKVIHMWSLGKASAVEKDAAVTFLVQLGAVQFSVQSGSNLKESERVSIHFEEDQPVETQHVAADALKPGKYVCKREKSVRLPIASQQNTTKEINPERKKYSSSWMTESDDDVDDDDDYDIRLPVSTEIKDLRLRESPRETYPCPDCHAILHSTWELDLHKLQDCEKALIRHVYNCDQCTRSFFKKALMIYHLRKVHSCSLNPSEIVHKLQELKSAKRQKSEKEKYEFERKSDKAPTQKSHRRQSRKERREQRKRRKAARRKKRCEEDAAEQEEKNLMINEGEPADDNTENESSAISPVSDVSETETKEESRCSLTIPQMDDDHRSVDERVEENRDAPSNDMKRENEKIMVTDDQVDNVESDEANRIREASDKGTIEDDQSDSATRQKSAENGGSAILCILCDMQFETFHQRGRHMLEDHKEYEELAFKCSTCGKAFLQKSVYTTHVKTHMDKEEREKHYCELCGNVYLSKYDHIIHMEWHSQRYKCETCGKVLSTKRTLERHINSVHTKEIKFPCEICGKEFYNPERLRWHAQNHIAEREFECDICGKAFLRARSLKKHKELVHTDAGHCICEVCGSAFKTPGNLRQHARTIHSDEYKYCCEICGKKFKRSSHLNAHMKVHSDDPADKRFTCQLCGKGFRVQAKLTVHMNWHYDIRSHTCDVCGKSFLTKGNLTKHMFIHQNKKPHQCHVCLREFTDLPGLRKHLDVVHKIILKKVMTQRNPQATNSTEPARVDEPVDKPDTRLSSQSASGPDHTNSESAAFGHQTTFDRGNDGQVPEASVGYGSYAQT
ncbi:zinc finger protein 37-like [Lytechinus variegatus]|uniref:zinc finger protein 37-like n=1 Tax=Lytechinus variegatus TaxID=7654 RepID=UPI001BB1C8C5|nr:zinc finger protein 37-like [Lytechinus variegatus]